VTADADLVLICDVLHHVADRQAWLARLSGQMKSEARLALIEFREGNLPEGPPESMKIPRDELVKIVTDIGLKLTNEHAVLLPYQTFLVFTKPLSARGTCTTHGSIKTSRSCPPEPPPRFRPRRRLRRAFGGRHIAGWSTWRMGSRRRKPSVRGAFKIPESYFDLRAHAWILGVGAWGATGRRLQVTVAARNRT
jgi:hypothetical protein